MIDAKTAMREATFNSVLKVDLEYIEQEIMSAVKDGKFKCTYSKYGAYSKKEESMIIDKLTSLGYAVSYDRNIMPLGCPSDQWSPYSYLKISWG